MNLEPSPTRLQPHTALDLCAIQYTHPGGLQDHFPFFPKSTEGHPIASAELAGQLTKLRRLAEKEVPELEKALEAAGAPWTPGRLPEWKEK